MNPFRFLLLPLAAMLLCVSCGQKQSTQKSSGAQSKFPIHIQLSGASEYKNTLTLNDIASDIQYIPLETKSNALIGGDYSSPKFTREYIFIETQGRLMQFDRQGKFIRRINKFGKGPGECSIRDYEIDETRRLIYIFDNWNLGIYTFTFEGEHVKTLRNPFAGIPDPGSPDHMGYDEVKGNLFFSFDNSIGNMKYKYVVTDTAGNVLYKCPNYTKYHLSQPNMSTSLPFYPIYRYDSSYYYKYTYNDTVFVINDDYSCSPAYIRHLPNRMTLKDDLELHAEVVDPLDISNRNTYTGIYEDRKYVYLYYKYRLNKNYIFLMSLYEKRTGTLIENINPQVENNWDGGMDVELYSYWQSDNQFCLLLQPYGLKETLTAEYFAGRKIAHPDKAEALKKLVSTLKEEDNPVLMVITMKQ